MTTLSKYQKFLKGHLTQSKDSITHTRIGDRASNVYGGAYCITEQDLEEFYNLYSKVVIEGTYKEYLT